MMSLNSNSNLNSNTKSNTIISRNRRNSNRSSSLAMMKSSSSSPLLVIIFGLLLLLVSCSNNNTFFFCQAQQQQMQNQQQQMQQQQQQIQQQLKMYENAVIQNPTDAESLYMLGWFLLAAIGDDVPRAIQILQDCFNSTIVELTLDKYTGTAEYSKIYLASSFIGRYLNERSDHFTGKKYLKIAYDISKNLIFNFQAALVEGGASAISYPELCVQLQLSSQFDSFPLSNENTDFSLNSIEYYQNEILDYMAKHPNQPSTFNEQWLSTYVPGVRDDPYVHCMLTLIPLSFYYRADVAKIASNTYKITSYIWPELNYVAPHVIQYEQEKKQLRNSIKSNEIIYQKCITSSNTNKNKSQQKIRLGVISATIGEGHSISEDFGGILSGLDRTKFDVTYLNVHERSYSDPSTSPKFLTVNKEDTLHRYIKNPNEEGSGSTFIKRIATDILRDHEPFDIILYLDLTMSTFMRRLGMMRLAPIQINTHGHPGTCLLTTDELRILYSLPPPIPSSLKSFYPHGSA